MLYPHVLKIRLNQAFGWECTRYTSLIVLQCIIYSAKMVK